ncbi:hypothetical protein GCM10009623_36070 [Nocardioides aestuarii]|uniref:Class I SAM-dependent methyltransferase n=1 Tax=Nocardioides aestuarii TaxID=252231 RepID=A0ABW4TU53_9ACTN
MTDTAVARPDRAEPARRLTRFGHLTIEYDERVLRPRSWTARQSVWAADLLQEAPPGPVLELCCGAGHIGLLAVAASERRLVCLDTDPVACGFAGLNARRAGISGRVDVVEADLDSLMPLDQRFAMVLADPPYLRSADTRRFPDDPLSAIDGGPDGMRLVWPCLDVVREWLLPEGSALLQLHSAEQARRVSDALDADGDLSVLEWRSLGRGVVARIGRP